MACCEPVIQAFYNESITTVPFGDYERSIYGSKPSVDVLYQFGTDWIVGGVFTDIRYLADTISVEHGGESTGFVKVS